MKSVWRSLIVSALSLLLLPTVPRTDRPASPAPLLLVIEQPEQEAKREQVQQVAEKRAERTVRLRSGQAVTELPLEEYLIGVVLSELPASFSPEAFKAQAVAARTFALKRCAEPKHADCDLCADAACCQAWTGAEGLREKYGADFDALRRLASDAVSQTAGEALYYGDALIDAVYFSCSGGQTEDALAVWGTDVPYLQSVESPWEQDAPRFSGSVTVTAAALAEKLLAARPDCALSSPPEDWFGRTDYTRGGGVASMEIGGQAFTGTELRSLLGLDSTVFSVSVSGEAVTFRTRGFGHRVGMSQYGAEALARQGFDYAAILRYYYQGTEIKKLPG